MRVVTSAVACSAVALFLHGCGSQSNSFESTEHGIKVSNSDGDVQVEVAV